LAERGDTGAGATLIYFAEVLFSDDERDLRPAESSEN
jgi:hypothetical protein